MSTHPEYKRFQALPPQNESERQDLAKYQASNPSQLAVVTSKLVQLQCHSDINKKLELIEQKLDKIIERLSA